MKSVMFTFSAILFSSVTVFAQSQDAASVLELRTSDPNAFVLELQKKLRQEGQYDGQLHGQLTSATIRSINKFCESAGVRYECQLGPLSDRGARALTDNLFAAELVDASPITWSSSSKNGLSVDLDQSGDAGGVTASVSGTASEAGWVNIDPASSIPVKPGEAWGFHVDVSASELSPTIAITARLAAFGEGGKYLGEIVNPGKTINDTGRYHVEGNTPEGAASIRPYIQVRAPRGETVNGTISISEATVGKLQ